MEFKAAIFDMDGTLIDSLILWDLLWKEFGRKYLNQDRFTPTPEDDKAVRTIPLKQAMTMIHEHYGFGESAEEVYQTAHELFKNFYLHTVKMKPGAKEFLDHLKNKGVKMCVASATSPDLMEVILETCGIKEHIVKFFSCSVLGKGKDDPELFLMAREYLGESIADTWVFDDSLVAVETATKIGLPTVGVYDCHNSYGDKVKEIATLYVAEGETLMKLI